MNRGGVNRVTQIGVETTSGTAVAANRFTPTLSWNLQRMRDTKKNRAQGSKTPSNHVIHKKMANGSVEGILDYNSIIYLLDSLFNAASANLASGAYTRTYTPGVRSADGTGKTYTVEDGDSTACEDFPYVKVTSLEIGATQDDFTVSGNLISRYPVDNQSLASSPTVIPELPVERNDINLYIDDSFAALGGTQITEALEEQLTIPDKFIEFFVHNRTAGEFHDIVERDYEPTFSFSTVHNSQSRSLIAAIDANPNKWLRWEAIGPTVGSTTAMIRIDMCVKFDTPERIGESDSPLGYKYSCSLMPDDAGLTSYMVITSRNGLATL